MKLILPRSGCTEKMQIKGVVGDFKGIHPIKTRLGQHCQGLFFAPHHAKAKALVIEAYGHAMHEADGI